MAKYEDDEVITYYFIIKEDDFGKKIIQAWTENKTLAKYYMEFHKCKDFRLKILTDTSKNISKIVEENLHDEILIYNLITKNRKKNKKGEDIVTIAVPLTSTEKKFIQDEIETLGATSVDYGCINDAMSYLKNKHQQTLQSIFLLDMIKSVVYSQNNKFVHNIEFDELMLLYKHFDYNFGK